MDSFTTDGNKISLRERMPLVLSVAKYLLTLRCQLLWVLHAHKKLWGQVR